MQINNKMCLQHSASIISIPFLSHKSLNIFPMSAYNFPYISARLNFGAKTILSSVATASPSRTPTVVSSSSASRISISESGTDKPFSHFETVCRTIFNFMAARLATVLLNVEDFLNYHLAYQCLVVYEIIIPISTYNFKQQRLIFPQLQQRAPPKRRS